MKNIFRELRHNEVRRLLREFGFNSTIHYVVDIGSGSYPLFEGNRQSIRIDKEKKADIKSDARFFPFKSEILDYAVALEIIEHFHYLEQIDFLSELERTLNNGGIIILSLPNYSKIMKPFQDLVWFIRERTTQREYFHNEKMHTHVGLITPDELINWIKRKTIFKIEKSKTFLLYDYILVIRKI